jgi:hypothetical protein
MGTIGGSDLCRLFCFQSWPFRTRFPGISQHHAGRALVWLRVWRFHRSIISCSRICVWGRKQARNACLVLSPCGLTHTQLDWIRPLFRLPKTSACAVQVLWQTCSGRRSLLQPLRRLSGFHARTHSKLTIGYSGGRDETWARILQTALSLVVVGLSYSFWGYILFDNLCHLKWLNRHSDVMPMARPVTGSSLADTFVYF